MFTFEGFFSSVGPQMHFDVGLVEEASMTDLTMVHHFLILVSTSPGHTSKSELWWSVFLFGLNTFQSTNVAEPALKSALVCSCDVIQRRLCRVW